MPQRSPTLRLDQLIAQRGLAENRQKAKALIMAGLVEVNGKGADKPGRLFSPSVAISLKKGSSYVSRGGQKLEAALEYFSIDVRDKVLLDVGAYTGGFTHCLLRHGARRVVAVDVGYGQLDWRLRNDSRVVVLERTNIRYLKREDIAFPTEGAVIDVSFIALRLVVPDRQLLPGRWPRVGSPFPAIPLP